MAGELVLDTGALVSLLDRRQAAHGRAAFGKCEELRSQERGAFARRCDVFVEILHGAARFRRHFRQRDIPLNHGEEVIEVVGNAARQHSKRFQVAPANQLFLHRFSLFDFSSQPPVRFLQFARALIYPVSQFIVDPAKFGFGFFQGALDPNPICNIEGVSQYYWY